jgi:hypothetical protein
MKTTLTLCVKTKPGQSGTLNQKIHAWMYGNSKQIKEE